MVKVKKKNSKEKYFQVIPEKIFDGLESIADCIKPEIKGFNIDNLKEVISIIACHVRKNGKPSPLSMGYINKIVPQGQFYLTALINLGIIERFGNFIIGECCYKYNFAPEFQSKLLRFELNNPKLILRIKGVWRDVQKKSLNKIRRSAYQVKFLKLLELDESYKDFINENFSIETEQYNSIIRSITRIEHGDIFHSIDPTSGRFHSNLTNMSKKLRPFLRIQGQPLANIDIKNSQAYLSVCVLLFPQKVAWLAKDPDLCELLLRLEIKMTDDMKKYIELVVNGGLYEFLAKEFNLSRDETKRQVLRILFARNRTPKDQNNKKCRQIFKDIFPTVHKVFSKIRGYETTSNKFSNYKRFAILMQRIESYIMLDKIIRRIHNEMPGVIAMTIHDSIMTGILTNNVEAVRKVMDQELKSFVGMPPTLKIEIEDYELVSIN